MLQSADIAARSFRHVINDTGRLSWSGGSLILAFALAFGGLAEATEAGPQQGQGRPAELMHVDIPSQPLEDALLAYATATGVEVFVDHALAAGQRSSQVDGKYDKESALRLLLAGTGLELRRAAEHAFTLVAIPPRDPPADRLPSWSGDDGQRTFFTALQTAIKQTLCARPETMPGHYRAALAVWIDSAGRVVNARVLSTNGKAEPPTGLAESIRRVSVGLPPPTGLEQPVTFVILPRSAGRTRDCAMPRSVPG